jgi:hypothetical protein
MRKKLANLIVKSCTSFTEKVTGTEGVLLRKSVSTFLEGVNGVIFTRVRLATRRFIVKV